MKLWLLLFTAFVLLFGAPLLVWWRVAWGKRQRMMMDSIRAGVAPVEGIAKAVVLVAPPPVKPGRVAGFFQCAPGGEDAGSSRRQTALLTAGASLGGLVLGLRFTGFIGAAAPIAGAFIGAILPRMYHARKQRKRLAAIEEQFPEALDFLGRSVRAGNAFSVAIELLCAELSEPLKAEFQKVTREMALGARLEDALNGLIERVPLLEVRFFVSAVLLQRDTGGNLSEVIRKLSISLRERFKLRGHVKAASGQGRLTAIILTVLPVATFLMLRCLSPDYISNLTDNPIGRVLLVVAVCFQIVGYLAMKAIINIEV